MAETAAAFRLETPRLVLRDWREADWALYWHSTNTPEVMRWLGGVQTAEQLQAGRSRIESYRRDFGHTFWVVERKADEAVLGFCGLKRSNRVGGPQGDHEIGWRLRADAWGQGYAREAATASLHHAFTALKAPYVIALTVEGNRASWGLMQRLGMMRRPDLDFDGADADTLGERIIVHSIERAVWEGMQ